MSLSDQDKQAMIRAYAEANDIKYEFALGDFESETFEAMLWQDCWLIALRHGLNRARELCQARTVRGDDAVDCVTDIDEAITAAMPAKEGE